MLVWGSSPQALRLQYQAKKRAKAAQKQEAAERVTAAAAAAAAAAAEASLVDSNDHEMSEIVTTVAIKPITDVSPEDKMTVSTTDAVEKIVESTRRSKSLNDLSNSASDNVASATPQEADVGASETKPKITSNTSFEEESNEHLYPSVVDTVLVDGSIIQVCKHFLVYKHLKKKYSASTDLQWSVPQRSGHRTSQTLYVGQKFGKTIGPRSIPIRMHCTDSARNH